MTGDDYAARSKTIETNTTDRPSLADEPVGDFAHTDESKPEEAATQFDSDSADRAELTLLAIERGGHLCGHALNPERMRVVDDTPPDVEAGHAVAVATAAGRHRQGHTPATRGGLHHLRPNDA